jgi:hypothetical protein
MNRNRIQLPQDPQIQQRRLEGTAVPTGFVLIPVGLLASTFASPSVGVPAFYRMAYEEAVETMRQLRFRRMILRGTGCHRWN